VLLLEQVDRLSRLNETDWLKLRADIEARGVLIVAQDLPTLWTLLQRDESRELMRRMTGAVNAMLLDMLAAVPRKDYLDRRRRQAEGISKAKAAGAYKGPAVDTEKRSAIRKGVDKGLSWQWIQTNLECSRATIASVSKDVRQ
jgi:DNA invertase Pin-like site-specific DNA recombinase